MISLVIVITDPNFDLLAVVDLFGEFKPTLYLVDPRIDVERKTANLILKNTTSEIHEYSCPTTWQARALTISVLVTYR